MDERALREQLHRAAETRLSSLQGDPWLAQRVLAGERSPKKAPKRLSVGIVLLIAAILAASVALAVALVSRHEIELFEEVDVIDLLPEQWRQYAICHRLTSGYVVGGFELGDDLIAPMDEDAQIICFDEGFHPLWTLRDLELAGCLFDRVRETEDSLYFGLERKREEWIPSILRISKSGDIVWSFEGTPDLSLKDFIVNNDGEVLCAGNFCTKKAGMAEYTAALVKLNHQGQVELQKELEEADVLYSVRRYRDKTVAAGKNGDGAVVLLLDEEGNVERLYPYPVEETISAVHLQETQEGKLVLVVRLDDGTATDSRTATDKIQYLILNDEGFQ